MPFTGIDALIAPRSAESFNVAVELVPPREYGLIAARLRPRSEGADYLAEHRFATPSRKTVQHARDPIAALALQASGNR